MQALIFDTTIFPNGVIKIPELSNWKDFEVSVIVVKKTKKNKNSDNATILADFNRIRLIKTGKAEVLTQDKAIKIYDDITSIS